MTRYTVSFDLSTGLTETAIEAMVAEQFGSQIAESLIVEQAEEPETEEDAPVATLYQMQIPEAKCGFCNFDTHYHCVLAQSREEALDMLARNNPDRIDLRGFCSRCLLDEVIMPDSPVTIKDIEEIER